MMNSKSKKSSEAKENMKSEFMNPFRAIPNATPLDLYEHITLLTHTDSNMLVVKINGGGES